MIVFRTALILLAFAFGTHAAAAAIADPVSAWTTPAKVSSFITPCLKTTGDDQPSKATPCTTKFVTKCSAAANDTTMAMTECADAAVTYWRGIVTQRTNALLARHNADITGYIKASDPAYQRYVKTRCSMYALFDGTMWGPVGVNCVLETTVQRADDLAVLANTGLASANK
jgi:hypothetical protein